MVMSYRRRRFSLLLILPILAAGGFYVKQLQDRPPDPVINGIVKSLSPTEVQQQIQTLPTSDLAGNVLETLPVKGRAPKTGYARSQFGDGWAERRIGQSTCDMRNIIMGRDMVNVTYRSPVDCTVMSGTLASDPYTGKTITFSRGPNSAAVQIDHIVALSNAWQTGAQQLTPALRQQLANDPLELLAVDGPANQKKSDGDAATWLPANKEYRCKYIARQIAVKQKYTLWVTEPERNAMRGILASCPDQKLPTVDEAQ